MLGDLYINLAFVKQLEDLNINPRICKPAGDTYQAIYAGRFLYQPSDL